MTASNVKKSPKSKPTPVEAAKARNHEEILDLIREKLAQTNNRKLIAEELGMSRRNLYRYLHELGVIDVEPVLVAKKSGGFRAAVKAKDE